MEHIEFAGRSGRRLVGRLSHADSACAVVMVHGFLSDKEGNGLFPIVADSLRQRGWSSLRFDLSGSGESDDNTLSPANAIADLDSAIGLMRSMCYRQIALWGHGLGSRYCVELPTRIDSMVLTDALLGRLRIDWRAHFSAAQLSELAKQGYMSHIIRQGPRKRIVIDQTLLDYYTQFEPGRVLPRVRCPVLVLHAARAAAQAGQPGAIRALMHLLPQGSDHRLVTGTHHSVNDRVQAAASLGASWIEAHGKTRIQRWR